MKTKMKDISIFKRIFLWFMLRNMNDRNVLSLDKSWHTVHFLLTGDKTMTPRHIAEKPLHNVVMGGTPTPVDGSYGPVRVLEKSDVKAIAAALMTVDPESMKTKYTIAELNAADTYATPKPGGWDQQELEIVFACIPRLKQFFAEAADSEQCVGIAVV